MSARLPIHNVPKTKGSRPLRVGDLAKRTGKTVRALHLYEERGLLEPVDRSKGGYRLYAADSVIRVRWINQLQEIGLSLPAIRELLDDWSESDSAPGAMRKVESLFRDRLEETKAQIEKLSVLRDELEASLRYLETCETACDPEVILEACPSCERHACDNAPVLVAGFHAN